GPRSARRRQAAQGSERGAVRARQHDARRGARLGELLVSGPGFRRLVAGVSDLRIPRAALAPALAGLTALEPLEVDGRGDEAHDRSCERGVEEWCLHRCDLVQGSWDSENE